MSCSELCYVFCDAVLFFYLAVESFSKFCTCMAMSGFNDPETYKTTQKLHEHMDFE